MPRCDNSIGVSAMHASYAMQKNAVKCHNLKKDTIDKITDEGIDWIS